MASYSPNQAKHGALSFLKKQEGIELSPKRLNFSKDDSFDIFRESKMSKGEYENLRKSLEKKNVKLFSYESLRSSVIKHQNQKYDFFINNTSMKICPIDAIKMVFLKIINDENFVCDEFARLKFHIKLGMDGGQTMRTIQFQKEQDVDDSNIFILSFVPMAISSCGDIIWKNSECCSVGLYC